jgi:D-3-phosphoglycerate dehydrogenase / 2-oxoglutarate reductase
VKPTALIIEAEYYPLDLLHQLETKVSITKSSAITQEQLRSDLLLHNTEILFCGLGININESLLGQVTNIKYVVSPATGINHLDIDYLNSRNIKLIYLGDFSREISNVFSTAELTWSLLLTVVRRIIPAHGSVVSGSFDRGPFLGIDLAGRTLGVIGYGRLGRRVAEYGKAFGMKVVVCDIDDAKVANLANGIISCSLDQLLSTSDVVSIHVPLNQQTHRLITDSQISKMKNGAVLINTSRGEVLDELAIVAALTTGKLHGVGVDVLVGENANNFSSNDSPLVKAASRNLNVVVSPHIGGWTKQAVATTRTLVVEELLRQL